VITRRETSFAHALSVDTKLFRWQLTTMTVLSTIEAGTKLEAVLDDAASSHEPIQIVGENTSAFLVAEDDWRGIQETLYLLSLPGMRASIREGLATPLADCVKFPG
jgi:PHD/YefM family antitoxin component YafN of YafNO toxin-antitoxin module